MRPKIEKKLDLQERLDELADMLVTEKRFGRPVQPSAVERVLGHLGLVKPPHPYEDPLDPAA